MAEWRFRRHCIDELIGPESRQSPLCQQKRHRQQFIDQQAFHPAFAFESRVLM